MKPLILWARNRTPRYTLRLLHREGEQVSGLVRIGEAWIPFRYDGARRELALDEGEERRLIRLNEWGWEE
ncbi:MAG: hypothetical protein RMN24_09940 [Anaerolineae bacterium]|nr:hypothetical protein [Caldilineales bacterium]MDW8269474.1 hypothetical protein [Anaerolineae bacterium]